MNANTKPSWSGLSHEEIDRLSDDPAQVEAWKAEHEALGRATAEAAAPVRAEYKAMVELAKRVFSRTPKVVRYLEGQCPDLPHYGYDLNYVLAESRRRKEKKVIEKRDQDSKREGAALIARATAYLIGKGKVIGVDFAAHEAVYTANELRFAELLAEAKKNGPHPFDGQNCDGPCEGWDGENRRCECGNRRVSWVWEGNFEDMGIRGEAY